MSITLFAYKTMYEVNDSNGNNIRRLCNKGNHQFNKMTSILALFKNKNIKHKVKLVLTESLNCYNECNDNCNKCR